MEQSTVSFVSAKAGEMSKTSAAAMVRMGIWKRGAGAGVKRR